jgi:hypothetical protein
MRSSRARSLPALSLPRLEVDGQTHRRDCECPRCEAGFGPSDGQRSAAARRWEEQRAREQAAAALERRRARAQIKALGVTLALEEEERRTAARLRDEAALARRLRSDPRLTALLDNRARGRSPEEAIREAETRHPPRSAER